MKLALKKYWWRPKNAVISRLFNRWYRDCEGSTLKNHSEELKGWKPGKRSFAASDYQVAGQKGTWLVSDEVEVDGQRFVQMRSEQTKNPPPSIILHESGAFVTQTALGFDGEATRKMSAFLQGQKPELLHHQKFFENGTAERAKESGTEQNYNMIDGCVNNVPPKPRRIGGRWSVLDRLHIKQAERRQKDNTPQQEQERSRKS